MVFIGSYTVRRYIRTVGRGKDGCNVAGVASGDTGSVRGMSKGRLYARFGLCAR